MGLGRRFYNRIKLQQDRWAARRELVAMSKIEIVGKWFAYSMLPFVLFYCFGQVGMHMNKRARALAKQKCRPADGSLKEPEGAPTCDARKH